MDALSTIIHAHHPHQIIQLIPLPKIPVYFITRTAINMQASLYPQPTLLATSRSKNQIKFPQDFQVILRADRQDSGNLYLGNIEAAENTAILENLRIGAVMCVAKGRAIKHAKELVKSSKYIPLEEEEKAEIGQYLEEGVNFINDNLKATNVLVHCVSGTNRSACFAIAFLMRQRSLSLEDAYSEVKSRRKVICLNDKMLTQLKLFERGISPKGPASIQEKSVRQEQPSLRINTTEQRSIKIKTNILDRSNFLGVEEQASINNSRLTGRSLKADDEGRSYRSGRSYNSKVPSNLDALNQSKIVSRNPEESFISKRSKPPTILNKSFSAYRQDSLSSSQVLGDLPQLCLQKKTSSSRQEFTQKIRQLDSKNSVINQKISSLHQRFENENQNSRLTLEAQLNQISQIRTNMYTERKNRLSRIAQDASGIIDYAPLHTTEK